MEKKNSTATKSTKNNNNKSKKKDGGMITTIDSLAAENVVLANTPNRSGNNTNSSNNNNSKDEYTYTSKSAGATPSSVVSTKRKEELLLEARSNRLAWIHRVPLPYRDDNNDDNNNNNDIIHYNDKVWNEHEQLKRFISSNYASSRMSSTTRVLSYLYGMQGIDNNNVTTPDQVAERIQTMLGPMEDLESKINANNIQKMMEEVSLQNNNNNDETAARSHKQHQNKQYDEELRKPNIDKIALQSYRDFWNKLQTPECALFVQGIRNFIRNLQQKYCNDITTMDATTPTESNNNEENNNDEMIEAIANTLKSYMDSTYESLKSHVAWKKSNMNDYVRRSLQSFLYGQCYPLLFVPEVKNSQQQQQPLLWTQQMQQEDQQWLQRLSLLQFISPKHLEIACLDNLDEEEESTDINDTQENSNRTSLLDQILKDPIDAMQSIDKYYSPLEKLYRILALFQAVNAALSAALNDHYKKDKKKTDGSNKKAKLPSADDILPTIILTIIKAKPKRLLVDLKMIEIFVPIEYLRGEAGYAYTNVYGAVQFLKDLDMHDPPKSLLISHEDFQKGLLLQKQKQQQESKQQQQQLSASSTQLENNTATISLQHIPTVQVVREARLRGDIVDLKWAIQYQQEKEEEIRMKQQLLQQQKEQQEALSDEDEIARIIREHSQQQQQPTSAGESSGQGEQRPQQQQQHQQQQPPRDSSSLLPPLNLNGFQRQYNFLTTNPEDIRITDLPQLLSEYKMLVHTTEILLSERATLIANEKKKKYETIQNQLMYTALQDLKDDPSLLATAVNGAAGTTANNNNVTPTSSPQKQKDNSSKNSNNNNNGKDEKQKALVEI